MRIGHAAILGLMLGCTSPAAPGDTDAGTSSATGPGDTPSSETGGESSGGTTRSTPETTTGATETTTGSTETTGPPPTCAPAPDALTPWLPEYVDSVVARLTGQAELVPGVTLTERSTAPNRAATADWLQAEFEALGLEVDRQAYAPEGTNIVGRLRATESGGRTLVFGAHFDTVPGSPGANDNATGVALMLSLARYLTQIECRSHDVVFVGFDQEEIGLVGSDAFASALAGSDEDVAGVHTVDQMGWDEDGDRAIELERADRGLFEFYEAASATLPMPIPLQPTNTGFTDHVSFRTYGFDAIGLTEEFVGGDTTPHYHLPSDTYETVNFDFLVSTCALVHTAFAQLIDAA